MRITSTIGANTVVHADVVYTAQDDGTFEVPETVGKELTAFPVWLEEWQAQELRLAAEREADTDAARQAARIAALETAVSELRELLPKRRAPRKPKAETEADEASEDDANSDTADDE